MEVTNKVADNKGLRVVDEPLRQRYSLALFGTIEEALSQQLEMYILRAWQLSNAG